MSVFCTSFNHGDFQLFSQAWTEHELSSWKHDRSSHHYTSLHLDVSTAHRQLWLWLQSRTTVTKCTMCCWPVAVRGTRADGNQSDSVWTSRRSRQNTSTVTPWHHNAPLLTLNTDWTTVSYRRSYSGHDTRLQAQLISSPAQTAQICESELDPLIRWNHLAEAINTCSRRDHRLPDTLFPAVWIWTVPP